MKLIRRYWKVLLLSSVLAGAAASAGEAICIQNATWISPDGTVQTCDWVCIINGGYIKSGCH